METIKSGKKGPETINAGKKNINNLNISSEFINIFFEKFLTFFKSYNIVTL